MQNLVTIKISARFIRIVFLLALFVSVAYAQSTDIAWPSPLRSNEVRSTIPARDLGDPRVTDHFYAFTGLPGDVLITVDSRNLNGDVDVFTLSGLRPLLKFTVYAESSSPITKSIYLRRQEVLILRVEGRTPNDDEAVYRLRFGGAFEPITSGPLAEHEDALEPATTAGVTNSGDRRVSSVGARIDEPRKEVVETPEPEPTPAVTTVPKPVVSKATTRSGRTRGSVVRRTPTARAPKSKPAEVPKKDESAADKSGDERAEPTTPTTPKTPPPRRGRTARAAKPPPPPQEPDESGPRLVIETSDGTLVDRSMAAVRRVTVENGQVVVIGKDGKI